jgi:hypothetical protein
MPEIFSDSVCRLKPFARLHYKIFGELKAGASLIEKFPIGWEAHEILGMNFGNMNPIPGKP